MGEKLPSGAWLTLAAGTALDDPAGAGLSRIGLLTFSASDFPPSPNHCA
jgi:hypothetical protein